MKMLSSPIGNLGKFGKERFFGKSTSIQKIVASQITDI